MKLTTTIFLFFIAQGLSAQTTDTIWYDNKWKKTDDITLRHYFRLIEKINEKNYKVKDYYETKSLQMEGFYSSLTPEVKHGKFQYWSENGKLQTNATYENGKLIQILKYNTNGDIVLDWERVTTYELANDKPIKVYKFVQRMPHFVGGDDALADYIMQEIRYPVGPILKGKVIVEFTLDQSGKALKPIIKRSLSPRHDLEVMRLVKNMPNWEMGKQDGDFVPITIRLPITF